MRGTETGPGINVSCERDDDSERERDGQHESDEFRCASNVGRLADGIIVLFCQ